MTPGFGERKGGRKGGRRGEREEEEVEALSSRGYVWQMDGVEEKGGGGEGGREDEEEEVSPVTGGGKEAGWEDEDGREGGRPEVVMDAMAYGMGCCCLQVRGFLLPPSLLHFHSSFLPPSLSLNL